VRKITYQIISYSLRKNVQDVGRWFYILARLTIIFCRLQGITWLKMAFLTRTDPSRNIDRFYLVAVTPTLFGEWAVLRE